MDLRDLFVSLVLPALRGACVNRLRFLPDRDERFQLAEAWAWYKLVQWTQQGKPCEPWRVVAAAIRYAMAGRPLPGTRRRSTKGPDALDRSTSGAGMDNVVDRAVSWEHAAEVAEEYRLWVQWCLTPVKRRIAMDLAGGMTTTDAAAKHGVSQGRISQLRMEFRMNWYEWWNRQ